MGNPAVKNHKIGLNKTEPSKYFANPLLRNLSLVLASMPGDQTIVDTMIKEGLIKEPVFAFCLSRWRKTHSYIFCQHYRATEVVWFFLIERGHKWIYCGHKAISYYFLSISLIVMFWP